MMRMIIIYLTGLLMFFLINISLLYVISDITKLKKIMLRGAKYGENTINC